MKFSDRMKMLSLEDSDTTVEDESTAQAVFPASEVVVSTGDGSPPQEEIPVQEPETTAVAEPIEEVPDEEPNEKYVREVVNSAQYINNTVALANAANFASVILIKVLEKEGLSIDDAGIDSIADFESHVMRNVLGLTEQRG